MENHHSAMDLADHADRAKRLGEIDKAKEYYLEAFRYESMAAIALKDRLGIEPTRSVFFRSAASLAIECNELREAERMIAFGLTGNPPDEIAEELRDLLETVHFEYHLKLRGMKLEPYEMQLSITGPAIGSGFAQSREFRERIEKVEILSFRTFERKQGRPFRIAGRPPKEVNEVFDVYVSVPRAACFAVTIRLAGAQELAPGFDSGKDVVTEIIECFDLINKRQDDELKARIADNDYYDNFVGIAKEMAPDGRRVTNVGLTCLKDGEEKKVKLERNKSEWENISCGEKSIIDSEYVEIIGNLRFADATKKRHGIIELIDGYNKTHKVKVSLGKMADIVRPMFEYEVIVKGKKDNKGIIILEDISRINEE